MFKNWTVNLQSKAEPQSWRTPISMERSANDAEQFSDENSKEKA